MSKIIGTSQAYIIPEKVKSILKIPGNYSFFAIPTDIIAKYGIEYFQIIKNSDNKIMLVGPEPDSEGPPTTNTPAKGGSSIDK